MADFVDKEGVLENTFVQSFYDGLSYMKEHTMDKGIGSMTDTFNKFRDENRAADGTFHEGRKKQKIHLDSLAEC